MTQKARSTHIPATIPYLATMWPSEMRWLATLPCEQQRMSGMNSGTCRSPIRSEGRAREDWCLSCQARELEEGNP